jgi:hypothetical protein
MKSFYGDVQLEDQNILKANITDRSWIFKLLAKL